MSETMLNQSLLIWALILVLGFPLLTIVLGEGIEQLQRRKYSLAKVLRNIRQFVLPPLAILLVMRQILVMTNTALLVRVVETLVWLAVSYTSVSLLNMLFATGNKQKSWQFHVPNLLFQFIRSAVVLCIVAYILATIWEVDLSQVAAAAGVGSLVIALALQDTLSNLVSGFLLIVESPFKVGDWILVGQIEGEVIEINWRAVRLRTRDRDVIIIPNGNLGKDTIQNYTILDPLHAVRILVRFSYFDPPNRVIQMLTQTALTVEGVASDPPSEAEPQLYINTAIEYEVRLFIKDFSALEQIQGDFLIRIYYAAKRYKLTVPYSDKVEYKIDKFPTEPGTTSEEISKRARRQYATREVRSN